MHGSERAVEDVVRANEKASTIIGDEHSGLIKGSIIRVSHDSIVVAVICIYIVIS